MKQIKQETGRSMVEMLGVLAVIGVLSVGGISGYTLAMNKHRANSVAADLMKRAMLISAQRQLGQTANVQGLGGQVGEYELGSIGEDDTNQTFGMTVKDVPQEVCEKILALDWDNATISPDTAEGCDGGDMTFTYNNDLSPVTGSNAGGSTGGEGGAGSDTPQETPCTGTGNGCQKCDENGNMVPDTAKNDQSCGEGGVCANGECAVCDANHLALCQSETECTTAQGKWCSGNNSCIAQEGTCPCTGDGYGLYEGECIHCRTENGWGWAEYDGNCYNYTDDTVAGLSFYCIDQEKDKWVYAPVTKGSNWAKYGPDDPYCFFCPDSKDAAYGDYCVHCVDLDRGLADYEYGPEYQYCAICTDLGEGYGKNAEGKCVICPNGVSSGECIEN